MQVYSKYKGAVGAKFFLGLFWPPPRMNLGSYCSENLATLVYVTPLVTSQQNNVKVFHECPSFTSFPDPI